MKKPVLIQLALLAALAVEFGPALADPPSECFVAAHQTVNDFPLPSVRKAIAHKELTILVVGAGSSTLAGAADKAYPARLEAVLKQKLPQVTVKVLTDAKPRRTAPETAAVLAKLVVADNPALVVWQAGTVDALRGIDPDAFKAALDQGVDAAQAAGSDTVLLNAQYSPRTESMIALGAYAENMRWVALQREIPLFDRFSVMKSWAELGTFDFTTPTKKLDMAERVHDCIGRLLADFILEAAKEANPAGAPAGIR
jgi:lysophospholipase L1-like esterase